MDPLTALLVAILLTSLGAKTVGAAVTDVIASSRGKTPPSQEKWQARQKARAARGEAPEKDPGAMRRRWRNAVEERNVKAAQKHQARMELLDENADTNVARHKDKLRKRAERWDKVGATVSELGASSWEAAKTAATAAAEKARQAVEQAKEAYDESQAWKENERRPADASSPDAPSPDASGSDTAGSAPESEPAHDGPDADVLPFRRPDTTGTPRCTWLHLASGQYCGDLVRDGDRFCPEHQQRSTEGCGWASNNPDVPPCTQPREAENVIFCAAHLAEYYRRTGNNVATLLAPQPDHSDSTSSTTPSSTTAEGNTLSTEQSTAGNTTTEITDLDSAIGYCQETAIYTSAVEATLADIAAQIEAAAQGLSAESAAHEAALGTISDEGFKAKVTNCFTAAMEALNSAVAALKETQEKVTWSSEEVAIASGQMRQAMTVFTNQQSLAESVNAEAEDAGVSKRTEFYAPA